MNDSELLKKLIYFRRTIHQNPELGNNEFKTANFIEQQLKQLKIQYQRLTSTGVIANIKNGNSKRCVALRADMDALPLHEQTSVKYASKNPGVMHACGHDAHVSMLLGAATLLSQNKNFDGTIKLIFQPNEEGAGGALSLIEKGVMKNPTVETVFGLHVNPRLTTGSIGIKAGPLMAAVDKFSVEIKGQGGHAAYPHEGRDPIPVVAEIIQSIQTIVSRSTDPLDSAVVTVGTIQGGTRYNILAEKVMLTGTVRTLSENVHKKIPILLKRIISGICQAHQVEFKLNYEVIGSVLVNDPNVAKKSTELAQKSFKTVEVLEKASMGGEDFSEYLKFAPGCFIYIGTSPKNNKKLVPWHHPQFNIDEKAMITGARFLSLLAQDFLKK